MPAVSANSKAGRRSRTGFSLLELLVVLALVVVLAGLVVGSMANMLQTQTLRQSADLLRARLAKTRVEAMRTGKIHVIEYAPETNQFGVTVWEGEVLEGEGPGQGAAPGVPRKIYPGGGSLAAGQSPEFGSATEFLPDGVAFVGGQTAADQRTANAGFEGDAGPRTSQSSDAAPIYFYPDGTTSRSDVVISNAKGEGLVISMRGLTGFAAVSEMQTMQGGP